MYWNPERGQDFTDRNTRQGNATSQVMSFNSLTHLKEGGPTYSKNANGDRTLFGGQKHLHISSAGLLHLTPFSRHFGLKPYQYFSCCNLELHTSKCTNSRKSC
jgi:hypothetical protein